MHLKRRANRCIMLGIMQNKTKIITRPPVVVVMGHVDHGKSALLDYIRKSNIVEGEAGGITQHISAYEVEHNGKRITFIDTPGHEAFGKMRARGAHVADIAILVVSAEDGVKQQTLDALSAVKIAEIPYIVAINKIDKPAANINNTKASLIENEIYIEGMGGDIPWNAISAKTGDGIDDLLDTILLVAEMEELTADPSTYASGVVIEAHKDPKSGTAATLLIKDGTLHIGNFIVAGTAIAPVRKIEDHTGKNIKSAKFSSPVGIAGFDKLPETGLAFSAFSSRKETDIARKENILNDTIKKSTTETLDKDEIYMPLVIKTDVGGTLDAIRHELDKLGGEHISFKIVSSGVGSISERDIQIAIGSGAFVIAFNVSTDSTARECARQHGIDIHTFNIIYKLTEWLEEQVIALKPKQEIENELGEIKVIKVFSVNKKLHVLGAKVKSGIAKKGALLRVNRRGEHITEAKIINLQQAKQDTDKIEEGAEFGAQIESDMELVGGDKLIVYEIIEK